MTPEETKNWKKLMGTHRKNKPLDKFLEHAEKFGLTGYEMGRLVSLLKRTGIPF